MTEKADLANLGAMPVPGAESQDGIDAPRRGPVYGPSFAVATDHPLASLAALGIRQRGGNAADAAIAASAVNAVVKPYMTQMGGDAFALIWRRNAGDNAVDCLNAGGLAPHNATLDAFPNGIDVTGPRASTVPGLAGAWAELSTTYGTFSLDKLMEPAIRLCEDGFPVSQRLSNAMTMLPGLAGRHGDTLRAVFLKDGRTPYAPGERLRQPELAETLRRIGDLGHEGFYEGETAEAIAGGMSAAGGLIDLEDLKQTVASWHEPLVTTYRGHDVYEQALPSQGIILLEALNIVEQFPLSSWRPTSADAVHVMLEATKLAFADSRRYSADPEVESVPVEQLLSKEHARKRAAEIDMKRDGRPDPAILASNTTEFVVGDEEMAVAFIQSVFSAWGSGFVVPGAGILMNNRLRGFSTNPGDANALRPGKRTVHTLNTFMVFKDGSLVVGGGTPGGDFQVQSNLQTICGVIDWGLDLQTAADTPRWATVGEGGLVLESRFAPSVREELIARGHTVHLTAAWDGTLSRTQVIGEVASGGWAVGSDLRGEGSALGC
jgi:gamma-glutamyltranspeptidase/glutathione hydrolase